MGCYTSKCEEKKSKSLPPRVNAPKGFVEKEGSKVDDEADEKEDGGLRGERGCVDKVRGGNIASVSWSRDLLTLFVTLLFIRKNSCWRYLW